MKSIAIAAALLFCSAPAFAQTPAELDPAKVALARQIMEASGGVKQAEAQIDAMYGAMFSKMAEQMPKDQQVLTGSLQHAMQKEMHALIPPIVDITVNLYAENFSEQELRDVLAFQRSPSGQALIRKSPVIMQQAMVKMAPLILADMPKVMDAVMDDVCTEQHCTAEQRKMVQAAVSGSLKPRAGA